MKYRLKKELPGYEVGGEIDTDNGLVLSAWCAEDYPDWFEPVTEKTIREWFQELPDGYRELAFGNTKLGSLDNVKESMADAIAYAFTWSSTKQGHKFWGQVDDHYTKGTPLPPLPFTAPAYTAQSFKVGDWVMFDGHKWQVTSIVEPYTLERYVGDRHEQAYVMPEDIRPVKTAPPFGGNTAKIPHATNITPGDIVTWQGHTGQFLGFDGEDACFSVNYAPYVIRANPWELEKVSTDSRQEKKEKIITAQERPENTPKVRAENTTAPTGHPHDMTIGINYSHPAFISAVQHIIKEYTQPEPIAIPQEHSFNGGDLVKYKGEHWRVVYFGENSYKLEQFTADRGIVTAYVSPQDVTMP